MALRDQIPELIKHYEDNKPFLTHNKNIFEILEGDLLDKVEKELREQLVSANATEQAASLIPPINILRRVVDKLTKIYSNTVIRTASEERYQPVVEYYVKQFDLNTKFNEVNRFFNSTKYSAVEPFIYKDEPNLRVLLPDQFLPYSDDNINPVIPTAIIKSQGEITKESGSKSTLLFITSDDEFIAVDTDGDIHPEFMVDNAGENPFGIIPTSYANKSRHLLIPLEDSDTMKMSILLPLLLSHLNYAIKFQSHSILYGIDIDGQNLSMNPDSFWILKSDAAGKKPEIGSLKPDVDIKTVDAHIMEMFELWMETRNIRVNTSGRVQNAISGVSLAIKEMDTTSDRKEQINYFIDYEKDFWTRMINIHNTWLSKGIVKGMPQLPEDFEVKVEFEEPKTLESKSDKITRLKEERDAGFTTTKRAIIELNPRMKEEEIDELLSEIEGEQRIIIDAKERSPGNDQDQ